MIGGGTQTFFGKYKDGSYRFLPFDYSHHESSWFVQLAHNETWVKINPNIPLENLFNWPPHRVLGEIEDVSNCQQCHGSQIVGRKVGGQYDIQFMSLAVNCESCHGPAKTHVNSMSKIVTDILHKDGQQKMSKSLDNHIDLASTEEVTTKRILTAFTDPQRTTRDTPGRPNVCNVYSLHNIFTNESDLTTINQECTSANRGCVDCKRQLAQNLNSYLGPMRERRNDLSKRPDDIKDILSEGAKTARQLAQATIEEVYDKMGLS